MPTIAERAIDLLTQEPRREWSSAEIASTLDVPRTHIAACLLYAMRGGGITRRKEHSTRAVYYSIGMLEQPKKRAQTTAPLPPRDTQLDDPRIPHVVPGWKPPVMVCVRLQRRAA